MTTFAPASTAFSRPSGEIVANAVVAGIIASGNMSLKMETSLNASSMAASLLEKRSYSRAQYLELQERSVRLQEQRFGATSHSAIVRALAERNIPLYDPESPGEIIED